MKREDVKELVERYLSLLEKESKEIATRIRKEEEENITLGYTEMQSSHTLTASEKTYYLKDMASKLHGMLPHKKDYSDGKVFRWLGFLQGALWHRDSYSIRDLRGQNKGAPEPMQVSRAREILRAYDVLATWMPDADWEVSIEKPWPFFTWTATTKFNEIFLRVHQESGVEIEARLNTGFFRVTGENLEKAVRKLRAEHIPVLPAAIRQA